MKTLLFLAAVAAAIWWFRSRSRRARGEQFPTPITPPVVPANNPVREPPVQAAALETKETVKPVIREFAKDVSKAWLLKGADLMRNHGRHADALQAFEKAIQLQPDDADAWIGKGQALFNLERWAEALPAYENAIQLKPHDAMAWAGKGVTLGQLGRHVEALQACEKTIELEPDSVAAWLGKGGALQKLGRHSEAKQADEKAMRLLGR